MVVPLYSLHVSSYSLSNSPYEKLFLGIYQKKIPGPPQKTNYTDRGPELAGPDMKEIYYGLGWPNTKIRSLEEFWTGNGA